MEQLDRNSNFFQVPAGNQINHLHNQHDAITDNSKKQREKHFPN